MRNIVFHDLAILELRNARDYYDSIYYSLGKNFVNEIEATLLKIREFPLSFPIIKTKIRRAIIKKFPYLLLFRIEKNEIFILAIMHQKRKPEYWIERL